MAGTFKAVSRRRVLAGIGAAAGTSLASGALAAGLLDTLRRSDAARKMRKLGIDVDPDKVIESARTIWEGYQLGEEDEIKLGEQLYPKVIALAGGHYLNGRVQAGMREFIAPLVARTERRHLPWQVTVVNDDAVNAWALPGGRMAVNKGLLRYVDSEDELAAVLAHEMGHVEHSHALQEMRNEKFMEGVSLLGRDLMQKQAKRYGAAGLYTKEVIAELAGPTHDLVVSGYSRGAEREADGQIVKVLPQVGYDPARSVNVFRTLLQLIPPSATSTSCLYSSHPDTRERIDAILAASKGVKRARAPRPSPAFAALKDSFPTRHYYKRRA